MAGPNVLWPPEHADLLKILAARGGSAAEIAAELNAELDTDHSRNAVIGKINRLKCPWNTSWQFTGYSTPKLRRKPRVRAVTLPKSWKTPPIKPPRAVTVLACADIVPKGIRCVDLEDGHCRWPYGEAVLTFCGHERVKDEPYCLPHLHLSRGEGTRSEREAVSV